MLMTVPPTSPTPEAGTISALAVLKIRRIYGSPRKRLDSIGGTTTCRDLRHERQRLTRFSSNTAHSANEFKEVADLDADKQMFTEMLVRIGHVKQMR